MKIKLLSDLHTEFEPYADTYTPADVLVLAGDIAVGRTNVRKVLRYFAERYPQIIYVMGNHEAYGGKIQDWDNIGELPDNVHFLNPGTKQIGDITFIGATLWTNFGNDPFAEDAARRGITDFYRIYDATINKYIDMYNRDFAHIKFHYENTPGKKVIVTHFMPASACVHPRWHKGYENLLNKYFANALGNWIANLSDTTWMFGHTHDSRELQIGDTKLYCNPKGYRVENIPNFNPNYIIEI